MQLIKRLFDFYIFSNIHVAVGVYFFVKISLLSFGIKENTTAIFLLFSTILSYNFIRFMDAPKRGSEFGDWFYKKKYALILLSIISGLICLFLVLNFHFKALLVLFPFVLLTIFYGIKIPKLAISLRKMPGLKIFTIAFCFAGTTVLFPLIQNNVEIDFLVWVFTFQRLLFVLLITLPFDIRDIEYDNDLLKTIPQLFGITTAKLIGVIFAILIYIIELTYHFENINNSIIVLLICFIATLFLLFSKKNQSKYYSAFWVESLPIIWYLLFCFV